MGLARRSQVVGGHTWHLGVRMLCSDALHLALPIGLHLSVTPFLMFFQEACLERWVHGHMCPCCGQHPLYRQPRRQSGKRLSHSEACLPGTCYKAWLGRAVLSAHGACNCWGTEVCRAE